MATAVMGADTKLLREISEVSVIADLSKLRKDDGQKLLDSIGQKKLTDAHVRALIEVSPQLIVLASDALKNISTIAEGAKETQRDALGAVKVGASVSA